MKKQQNSTCIELYLEINFTIKIFLIIKFQNEIVHCPSTRKKNTAKKAKIFHSIQYIVYKDIYLRQSRPWADIATNLRERHKEREKECRCEESIKFFVG